MCVKYQCLWGYTGERASQFILRLLDYGSPAEGSEDVVVYYRLAVSIWCRISISAMGCVLLTDGIA
ncbi:hypothetical protein F4X73_15190 [Candidatus Poribacteria bacterium]|nr:hypothetical protein [Candidatus Poribacteria bacterium]